MATGIVVVIRMTVAPIPICSLLFLFQFGKRAVLSVILLEIPAVGMVFVVIPIVIVLVVAFIDTVAILIVSVILFLASVVLLPALRIAEGVASAAVSGLRVPFFPPWP